MSKSMHIRAVLPHVADARTSRVIYAPLGSGKAHHTPVQLFFTHVTGEVPADIQSEILEKLPEETRATLKRFTNPARYQEALLGRGLAQLIAAMVGEKLIEEPPYSPRLTNSVPVSAHPMVTIAHTSHEGDTWVAAMPAPDGGFGLAAVDVEVMRPRDNIEEIVKHSFAPEVAERILATMATLASDEDRLALFYRVWGEHECAVKLNRGKNTFRVGLCANAWAVKNIYTGEPLVTSTYAIGNTLFTLVVDHESVTSEMDWIPVNVDRIALYIHALA